MAGQGAKNDGKRAELVGEYNGLVQANLKQDGTPRADAVPQELKRIEKLRSELGITDKGKLRSDPEPEKPAPKAESPPAKNETDAQKLKRLERENTKLKNEKKRGRAASKIQNAQNTQTGHVPRPDEIMSEALEFAEDNEPEVWDGSTKLAVEREIRKYVRQGGAKKDHKGDWSDIPAGFKKNLTVDKIRYALDLLEKMGRIESADKIYQMILKRIKEISPAKRRQSSADFNKELEGMGVAWDPNIQVPGMSAVAGTAGGVIDEDTVL